MMSTGALSKIVSMADCSLREVVERRLYTVTGEHASEEKINYIINSGQAENIFQEALMSRGRGKVQWE